MPQPPLQLDALQIVGDSGLGTRLIEDDIPTGSLRFTDNRVPGGINLEELIGIQQITGLTIAGQGLGVSQDAQGNPITTVQAALDAVPVTASAINPHLILLMPGVYIEDIQYVKDGVHMIGMGNVVIRNATAGADTISMVEGTFTTPQKATFQNLRIENTSATEACVALSSARFATGTIVVSDQVFVGDTVSINGITLTAVANGTTPVAGEFEIGLTFAESATNLTTAINDPINTPLNTTVIAFDAGATVTLRAFQFGLVGNTITLATSVPLTFVLSGATLAGGLDSQAGSNLGADRLAFLNCDLVSLGATGFQVRAVAVNNLYFQGGDYTGSSTGSTFDVRQCARVEVVDVSNMRRIQMDYDTGGTIPAIASSEYSVRNCTVLEDSTSTLTGGGSMSLIGSTWETTPLTTMTFSGDQPFRADNCRFGDLSVLGTAAVSLRNSSRLTVTGSATASLAETMTEGSEAFVASATQVVPFPVPQPDANYTVLISSNVIPAVAADIAVVSAQTPTDFTIQYGAVQTSTVRWTVTRQDP